MKNRTPLWNAVAAVAEVLAWLVGIVWIIALMAVNARADECPPPPAVIAAYDGLVFVQCRSLSQDVDSNTVYFFRDGRLIAERCVTDDMQVTADGGEFFLAWPDYEGARVDRLIRVRRIVAVEVVVESHSSEQLAWWDQRVRRTNLEEAAP